MILMTMMPVTMMTMVTISFRAEMAEEEVVRLQGALEVQCTATIFHSLGFVEQCNFKIICQNIKFEEIANTICHFNKFVRVLYF